MTNLEKSTALVAIGMVMLASTPAPAQWLTRKAPGVPRTADGRPNLSAPTPLAPDGKPDLSGIWEPNGLKYLQNVAADLKPDEVPFQPWAEALFNERRDLLHARDEPDANCLPQGVPKLNAPPNPFKIIQTPGLVIILYEAFTLYRQIFTDGRELPADPNPTWLGYSVGRWEGDTLVVDSTGFNGKTWLDTIGHPTTDALHVTERFRRKDYGHMDIQITIDDPKAYTKPWTFTEDPHLTPDTELLEFICNENNKDIEHLTGR
jgi:hypothetical protein